MSAFVSPQSAVLQDAMLVHRTSMYGSLRFSLRLASRNNIKALNSSENTYLGSKWVKPSATRATDWIARRVTHTLGQDENITGLGGSV